MLYFVLFVGLFIVIFVKVDFLGWISNFNSVEVKRGMGGFYGNKGVIVVRFMVDDILFCFINCYLVVG